MELTLLNPAESMLLAIGGFIQVTGGNWVLWSMLMGSMPTVETFVWFME